MAQLENIPNKGNIAQLGSIPNKGRITIFNIPIAWFLILFAITLLAMYTGNLPAGIIGGILILMMLGEFFGWIGDNTPILRSYLGGGAIVCVFGSAFLVHINVIPEDTTILITDFMQAGGFLNFYIAGLITGSILGIDSKILIKAGSRFAIPLLAGVTIAILIGGLAGLIFGDSFIKTILIVSLPILGGGMGAGGIPMSQLYSDVLGNDPSYYISLVVPAIALANLFAIIIASILNAIGNKYPHLTGNGIMMPGLHVENKQKPNNISQLGIGLIFSLGIFVISQMLGKIIPLHPFALMILLLIIFKLSNILPEMIVDGAKGWYQFVGKNWTFAILLKKLFKK